MKFICRNESCKKFGIEDICLQNSYKYVDGNLQSNNAPCPFCGKIREEINVNKDIPLSEKNIDIGKYTNSSPEEQKNILKKRSHEHFKKTIQPEKEHRLNETVKQFKETGKY